MVEVIIKRGADALLVIIARACVLTTATLNEQPIVFVIDPGWSRAWHRDLRCSDRVTDLG
jgi:hypothetical protein